MAIISIAGENENFNSSQPNSTQPNSTRLSTDYLNSQLIGTSGPIRCGGGAPRAVRGTQRNPIYAAEVELRTSGREFNLSRLQGGGNQRSMRMPGSSWRWSQSAIWCSISRRSFPSPHPMTSTNPAIFRIFASNSVMIVSIYFEVALN